MIGRPPLMNFAIQFKTLNLKLEWPVPMQIHCQKKKGKFTHSYNQESCQKYMETTWEQQL